MLELLKSKTQHFKNNTEKYNYLREYFQLYILKILDEKGFFQNIAFMGGTALRILYKIERFSEDLNFNLIHKVHFDFDAMMQTLKREMTLTGLSVDIVSKKSNAVATGQVKIGQVLHALGVAPLKDQKIMIKCEVDQTPPSAFKT